MSEATVHASCAVVGEAGVLIRGESGAGKSSLLLALIDRGEAGGGFAALVADDRVRLRARHGRLVARPHPAIAGLVEVRGQGIAAVPHAAAAVVRLVVDLEETGERLPPEPLGRTVILGVRLPRLRLGRAAREAGLGPVLALRALRGSVASPPHSAAAAPSVEAAP